MYDGDAARRAARRGNYLGRQPRGRAGHGDFRPCQGPPRAAHTRPLGFDGKTLIHPKTIAAANTVFAPSSEDVTWSRRIIAAHGEAVAAGSGVVLVDGKLIENLHVESARELVALAEAIAVLEQGEP